MRLASRYFLYQGSQSTPKPIMISMGVIILSKSSEKLLKQKRPIKLVETLREKYISRGTDCQAQKKPLYKGFFCAIYFLAFLGK